MSLEEIDASLEWCQLEMGISEYQIQKDPNSKLSGNQIEI